MDAGQMIISLARKRAALWLDKYLTDEWNVSYMSEMEYTEKY